MRKTLHTVLTLALLILAAYFLHWQETEFLEVKNSADATETSAMATTRSEKHTNCCLQHAYQVINDDTAVLERLPEVGRILKTKWFLHPSNSGDRIASTDTRMQPTN